MSTLLTLPFIYHIYYTDELRRGYIKPKVREIMTGMKEELPVLLGIVVMAFCTSIVLNNVIAWTPLIQNSKSYQEVTKAFFGGRVLFEVLGPCIFVPILEEYIFRGIVYKRLREWVSLPIAIGASAAIFGIMHMNLVQFIYAGILGIFLAFCAEKTKYLYGAVLGHMAANTISVIRTETNWIAWIENPLSAKISVTISLTLVFIGLFILIFRKK